MPQQSCSYTSFFAMCFRQLSFLAVLLAFTISVFAADVSELHMVSPSFGGSISTARICSRATRERTGHYAFVSTTRRVSVVTYSYNTSPASSSTAGVHSVITVASPAFTCTPTHMSFVMISGAAVNAHIVVIGDTASPVVSVPLPMADAVHLATHPATAATTIAKDYAPGTATGTIVAAYPVSLRPTDPADVVDGEEYPVHTRIVALTPAGEGFNTTIIADLDETLEIGELTLAGDLVVVNPPIPYSGLTPLNPAQTPHTFPITPSVHCEDAAAVVVPGTTIAVSGDGLRAAYHLPVDGSSDSLLVVAERGATSVCFAWSVGGRVVPVGPSVYGRSMAFSDDDSLQTLFVAPIVVDAYATAPNTYRRRVLGFDISAAGSVLTLTRTIVPDVAAGDQATNMSRPLLAGGYGAAMLYDAGAVFLAPVRHFSDRVVDVECNVPGYYRSGTSCIECRVGYYCPGDNTANNCRYGTYARAGATTCLPCPAHTVSTIDNGAYTKCAAIPGYFGTHPLTPISLCPVNHLCTSAVAEACSPGYYARAGATVCRKLPPGTRADNRLTADPTPFYCPDSAYYGTTKGCAACSELVGTAYCARSFNPDRMKVETCPVGYKIVGSARTVCALCKSSEICDGTLGVSPNTILQNAVFQIAMIFALSVFIGLIYIIGFPLMGEAWRQARLDPASRASRAVLAAEKQRKEAAQRLKQTANKLSALVPKGMSPPSSPRHGHRRMGSGGSSRARASLPIELVEN